MVENTTGYCLDLIIHPGETLKEVLDDRGMSQKELSIRTGFTEKHISTVVKGKKGISNSFAKALEYALGIDTSFWCNLQNEYNQEIIELEQANGILDNELSVLENLKQIINYFKEKNILEDEDNRSVIVLKLRQIFNVSNLTFIPKLSMQGAFRAAETTAIDPYVLCAWQRICEMKSEDMIIDKALNTK